MFKTQIVEMKRTPKKTNILAISKHQWVKELEKLIELKDLETIDFIGCIHNMIWAMEKWEMQWVEKARLIHICKFNWTHVNLPMITKMICNYRIIEEATNLKGKEVDLTIEGIDKVFKLLSIGNITRRKEGYNIAMTTYFIGGK